MTISFNYFCFVSQKSCVLSVNLVDSSKDFNTPEPWPLLLRHSVTGENKRQRHSYHFNPNLNLFKLQFVKTVFFLNLYFVSVHKLLESFTFNRQARCFLT